MDLAEARWRRLAAYFGLPTAEMKIVYENMDEGGIGGGPIFEATDGGIGGGPILGKADDIIGGGGPA